MRLAVGVLAFLVLVGISNGRLWAADAPPADPPKADKPRVAAVFMAVEGTELQVGAGEDAEAAKKSAKAAKLGDKVNELDWVITGKATTCQINFIQDSSALKIAAESAVQIVKRTERDANQVNHTKLFLAHGQVRAKVARLRVKSTFEVSTPVAVCGVRGTEEDIVHIPQLNDKKEDVGESTMTVFEGLVLAKNKKFPDKAFTMDPGKRIKFSALKAPEGPIELDLTELRTLRTSFSPLNFSAGQVNSVIGGAAVPPPMKDVNAGFTDGFMRAASLSVNNQFFNTNILGTTGAGGAKDPTSGSNTMDGAINNFGNINPENGDFKPGTKPPPIPPGGVPVVGGGSGVGF